MRKEKTSLATEIINHTISETKKVLSRYERIVCAISGGSDSDVMLDIVTKADPDKKVKYLYVVPGLEYDATKRHIAYLQIKYDIHIEVRYATNDIRSICKAKGQPFLSKHVSNMISRLQKHGFDFTDKPYEELKKEYPNCQNGIAWWCNENGTGSHFNIERCAGLKEFLIAFPPYFNISGDCCASKTGTMKEFIKENNIELNIYGVRLAEGGIRQTAYSTMFSKGKVDEFRPLLFFTDTVKAQYIKENNIRHSDCYTLYGLKRTGCIGCPCGRCVQQELAIVKEYEPELFDAANQVFSDSYLYLKMYKAFKKSGFVDAKDLEEYIRKNPTYVFEKEVYVQETLI